MTSLRNRLLITLALFAASTVVAVPDAFTHERGHRHDTTGGSVTVTGARRPAAGPCQGEPDVTGGSAPGAPLVLNTKSGLIQVGGGQPESRDLFARGFVIWRVWVHSFVR
jgi:hypothetical protein